MLASPVSRPSDESAGPRAHTEVATLSLTGIQLQSTTENEGLDKTLMSVLSSPSFSVVDCSWMPVRDSVATSVWARGPALSSDGRDTGEANTSQDAELI